MPRIADLAPSLLSALSDPPARPFAITGRSGSGKTRLLRIAVREHGGRALWKTALDLVAEMSATLRHGGFEAYGAAFTGDNRPLCVEHLEDLRGKPVTRGEVRRLLEERAARGHAVLLSLTRAEGDAEIVEWLDTWADVLLLE